MRNLAQALTNIIIGLLLGVLLLEIVLQINPRLLLRGMPVPVPVDIPLTRATYTVHYSDADVFVWRPDLVRPVAPENDAIEAQVVFNTDEFGFHNQAPLPSSVDVVVVGRSTSLGAQAASPWPEMFAAQTGMQTLNLAEPGSRVDLSAYFFQQFALPRQPKWLIIEVLPGLDIFGYIRRPKTLAQGLPVPLIREYYLKFFRNNMPQSDPAYIYPISLDIPGSTIDLTCCIHYLDTYAIDNQSLLQSQDWQNFSQDLTALVDLAYQNSTCVALLYSPQKPEIYFPIAQDPRQLVPAFTNIAPLILTNDGYMLPNAGTELSPEEAIVNLTAARDALAEYARAHNLPFIDPTGRMIQSASQGQQPFMLYDSHWNLVGHQLVADAAAEILHGENCP